MTMGEEIARNAVTGFPLSPSTGGQAGMTVVVNGKE